MESTLLIAVVAGLGGMLGWGLADLFAKKTIDEIGDVVSLVIAHIFGTAAFLAIVFYLAIAQGMEVAFPQDAGTWAGLAFFGLLQGVVYLLVYKGFGKGQVAVLNPVFASFTGLVALVSVLFLGELVTGSTFAALLVVFIGVLLINLDPRALVARRLDFVHVPGFREVAAATVLAAVWTLGWNEFIGGENWLTYASYMYVFMTIALLIYAWVRKVRLRVTARGMWPYLILIGVCEMVAYTAISYGYSATTYTSVVALLSGAFSLPTILLARVFLKERTTHLQLIASVVIVVGIALLAVL